MGALTTVVYHAVAPVETDFERGLDVTTRPEKFEQHVSYFAKNYDIVDLNDVLSEKLPKKPLLITFDDYYESTMTAAREVLKPRGIKSMFFVSPALLGKQAVGLDNVIAFAINRYGMPAVCSELGMTPCGDGSVADFIANIASRMSSGEREDLKEFLLQRFGPTDEDMDARCRILEPSQLAECEELGMEVGNHTLTHTHGRALRSDELHDEIVASRKKLEELTGKPVRAFSLPYGFEEDLTDPVLNAIRRDGHQATFLVHARSNLFQMAPDIWYRISLKNETISEMSRKLTLMPLLRSTKDLFSRWTSGPWSAPWCWVLSAVTPLV